MPLEAVTSYSPSVLLMRSPATGWVPTLLGWVLGLVSFAYLLTLPPTLGIADESYLLYGAKRVLQGQALYRDFFDFVTPGSFYLYAVAYAIGGVSITTARITSALVNALAATCVYFLALHVAAVAEALLAGLLVVVICVPVWNQASNHWMATAFGLATATVLLATRWLHSTRGRPVLAGALAGLVVCTNQSSGLWMILWLAVTVPALTAIRAATDRWRRCVRELCWIAVGGAVVCLPVLGYAVWRSSFGEMLYATHTWVLENYRDFHRGPAPWSVVAWGEGVPYTYLWLFEWIPAILAVETVALSWAAWRQGMRSQGVRAALLLLAASASAGVVYHPDVIHVAFVAPFSLVVMAGMVYRARTALDVMPPQTGEWMARLAMFGLLGIVVAKAWDNRTRAWSANPALYRTAFGTLAGWPERAEAFRELHEKLKGAARSLRVFAYQGDAWLYLALPADNPTPFQLLLPAYNTSAQFQQAIDALERDPEARVVVHLVKYESDDPFITYLERNFREVATAAPVLRGPPPYRIFERSPCG